MLHSMSMCVQMPFRDKPSCCVSSRCSPPQRRALQRRVAPFIQEKQLLLPFFPLQLLVSDTLSSLSSRFPCSSSDVNHKFTPSSSYFTHVSSLAFGDSCGRAEAAARKHFMQIDGGVTSEKGAVIRAVGCSRAAFTSYLKNMQSRPWARFTSEGQRCEQL